VQIIALFSFIYIFFQKNNNHQIHTSIFQIHHPAIHGYIRYPVVVSPNMIPDMDIITK